MSFGFLRALGARRADVAQLVEHVLGKDGVSGSIPLIGSRDFVDARQRTRTRTGSREPKVIDAILSEAPAPESVRARTVGLQA